MKFLDNFIQGGQTQLHNLRMLGQVMWATLKFSFIIFLAIFLGLLYKTHGWQNFWFLICYLKAYIRLKLAIIPQGCFDTSWIYYRDGTQTELSDLWVINNESLYFFVHNILFSTFKIFIQSLSLTLMGSTLISMFWVKMGKKKGKPKILAGYELVMPKALTKMIKKDGTSVYNIADIPLPKGAEFQHMMITGTTGAGKTNAFHQLLRQIKEQGDQAVILDSTGRILSRFFDNTKDILLNPLDQRSQPWSLWNEVTNPYIVDELAESIVPQNQSYDQFWAQSARQLLVETIHYLIKAKSCTYSALLNMTLSMPLSKLAELLSGTAVSAQIDPNMEKTALSIRATLANSLRIFKYLEDSPDGLSLLSLLHKVENIKPQPWIFLSCLPEQRELLRPLFSVWISLIIKGIMRRDEDNPLQRTWIIIDELASLNRLPALLLGLSEIRKYGGCFVVGFQDLSQLEEIYGSLTTRTISNLTGTKLLFRCTDTDVATRVSRYLGEQEKQETNESISYGAHQMRDGVNLANHKQIKPLVNSSQIMMLKDLEAYLKFPGAFPVAKVEFDYLELPKITEGFVGKEVEKEVKIA